MEKIIHKLINEFIQGVDTYTHNGGTWLIFTESKRWVVELTKDKTLWYNYNFFKEVFSYASMDVVDNQQYITKWVEDNIINGVKRTMSETIPDSFLIEDTVQNGVKRTQDNPFSMITNVENTIKIGVKVTEYTSLLKRGEIEDIIDSGVKSTNMVHMKTCWSVNDTIENGVKETNYDTDNYTDDVKEVIKNGVKETIECDWNIPKYVINEVIIEGVKETKHANKYNSIGPVIKEGKINDIIDNGIKVSGTFVGGKRQSEKCKSVVEYGTKNPTD